MFSHVAKVSRRAQYSECSSTSLCNYVVAKFCGLVCVHAVVYSFIKVYLRVYMIAEEAGHLWLWWLAGGRVTSGWFWSKVRGCHSGRVAPNPDPALRGVNLLIIQMRAGPVLYGAAHTLSNAASLTSSHNNT